MPLPTDALAGVDVAADYLALVLEQGAAFELELEWQDADGDPVDLTGYTGKAQMREGDETTALILEFSVALGGAAGTITLSATAAQTATVTQKGHYDLYLTPPVGERLRFIHGPVEVSRRTTTHA